MKTSFKHFFTSKKFNLVVAAFILIILLFSLIGALITNSSSFSDFYVYNKGIQIITNCLYLILGSYLLWTQRWLGIPVLGVVLFTNQHEDSLVQYILHLISVLFMCIYLLIRLYQRKYFVLLSFLIVSASIGILGMVLKTIDIVTPSTIISETGLMLVAAVYYIRKTF